MKATGKVGWTSTLLPGLGGGPVKVGDRLLEGGAAHQVTPEMGAEFEADLEARRAEGHTGPYCRVMLPVPAAEEIAELEADLAEGEAGIARSNHLGQLILLFTHLSLLNRKRVYADGVDLDAALTGPEAAFVARYNKAVVTKLGQSDGEWIMHNLLCGFALGHCKLRKNVVDGKDNVAIMRTDNTFAVLALDIKRKNLFMKAVGNIPQEHLANWEARRK